MGGDPFAPARRALWLGLLVAAALIYLGIAWGGFALALCVVGGLLGLWAVILTSVGAASLGMRGGAGGSCARGSRRP